MLVEDIESIPMTLADMDVWGCSNRSQSTFWTLPRGPGGKI